MLSDNATAVAYISKLGGTRSRVLLLTALQILTCREQSSDRSTSERQAKSGSGLIRIVPEYRNLPGASRVPPDLPFCVSDKC